MARQRMLKSWLKGLQEFIAETESPRAFWLWSGLSTIASALQRKVWIPYGLDPIYPNLYVIIIGPPAARKGGPVGLSKRLLDELQITVLKDSGSKREMSKSIAEAADAEKYFDPEEKVWKPQSAVSIVSKEMSSLLAVDPISIIKFLTDLFDCHEKWDYGTSGQGCDILYNSCPNLLAATTPISLLSDLPQTSVGTGFTSRIIMVYGDEIFQRIPRPRITEKQKKIYKALVNDLSIIHEFTGPFSWTHEAEELFDAWYMKIDDRIRQVKEEWLLPFMGRFHVHILKVAMCLRVDTSDDLILTPIEIQTAIDYLEHILITAPAALAGHGSGKLSEQVHRISQQIKLLRTTTIGELLSNNLRELTKSDLEEILETLELARKVRRSYDPGTKMEILTWTGSDF